MSAEDPDVIVVGSGPNGLVAACMLARQGLTVHVLEAHPRRPGGALGSEELTRPGFIHDVGAGFFPFARTSPAFRALNLEQKGLRFHVSDFESCHVALDDSYACIARDLDLSASHFGSPDDALAWRKLVEFYRSIEPEFLSALLSPFPAIKAAFRLGPVKLWKLARLLSTSGRGLSERLFSSQAAQRVLPSLAMHVDIGPDDTFGAALGYVLGMTATTGGYAVPHGGAQAITNALVTELERYGGRLRLGTRVDRIIVRKNRACAVTSGGEEYAFKRALLADTSAPALLLELLPAEAVPNRVQRKMRRFPQGWGTFKLDFALDAAVPWRVPAARKSAVVHTGESVDDLSRFTRQVRAGELPEKPYLVIGQQSLLDASRAPRGQHTLYCYTHVPSSMPAGWAAERERFADMIETHIERLAPGFRRSILSRHITSPPDFERDNANLVGGDLGGGSNQFNQQLMFRPIFPYFRYRMPVSNVFLCSSYTHPGGGVHGMCGYNAAQIALRQLG